MAWIAREPAERSGPAAGSGCPGRVLMLRQLLHDLQRRRSGLRDSVRPAVLRDGFSRSGTVMPGKRKLSHTGGEPGGFGRFSSRFLKSRLIQGTILTPLVIGLALGCDSSIFVPPRPAELSRSTAMPDRVVAKPASSASASAASIHSGTKSASNAGVARARLAARCHPVFKPEPCPDDSRP